MPYKYINLEHDMKRCGIAHSIGKSVCGRELFCVKLGRGPKKILFCGAHHGMEWITSMMLVRFIGDYSRGYWDLKNKSTLYIVPMLNPDGVEVASTGMFWQANAHGVDLNHNYDADWDKSKQLESENGIYGPGSTRFSGTHPESEPESAAIAKLVRNEQFDAVYAFHSQGQVIYADFNGYIPPGGEELAERLAKPPYVIERPEGMAACGGFKDWFIKEFDKPGFTIEVGRGENPLPTRCFKQIYCETLPLMLEALK